MSREGQGKVKARSRQGQGKAKARPRRGQGKVKVRSKLPKNNLNRNYNLMGFDTIEINLVHLFIGSVLDWQIYEHKTKASSVCLPRMKINYKIL